MITLPQHFMNQGYKSIAVGKVFHAEDGYPNLVDKESWSVLDNPPPQHNLHRQSNWMAVSGKDRRHLPLRDDTIKNLATDHLVECADGFRNKNENFFLAIGFHKPHLSFTCPREFYDLYPFHKVTEAANDFCPYKMPREAWSNSREVRNWPNMQRYNDSWSINSTFGHQKTIELRRGYYSCVSYIDSLVGDILEKVDELDLGKDTIVAFLGDHGYHLGENGIWAKSTVFEVATHVPLMISIPGRTDTGIESDNLVELVDLFPTLVEAAGLDPLLPCKTKHPERMALCTEGISMLPLIAQPDSNKWKTHVFSQYPNPDFKEDEDYMGYSLRTPKYRYNEWVNVSLLSSEYWPEPHNVELYDIENDPGQTVNIADNSAYASIIETLSDKLHKGWQGALV